MTRLFTQKATRFRSSGVCCLLFELWACPRSSVFALLPQGFQRGYFSNQHRQIRTRVMVHHLWMWATKLKKRTPITDGNSTSAACLTRAVRQRQVRHKHDGQEDLRWPTLYRHLSAGILHHSGFQPGQSVKNISHVVIVAATTSFFVIDTPGKSLQFHQGWQSFTQWKIPQTFRCLPIGGISIVLCHTTHGHHFRGSFGKKTNKHYWVHLSSAMLSTPASSRIFCLLG